MSISYRIESDLGVVFTTATGVLTDDELLAHKLTLSRDPSFRPGMVELSDVRGVGRLEVTPEGVRRMVAVDAVGSDRPSNHKLAIVVAQDVVFGMARMYEMLSDPAGTSVRIFRGMDEAKDWLGL